MLRREEEFVKDSLVKYFGGPGKAKAQLGEDPPDIYIEIEGIYSAVEITTLSPISFDEDGAVLNRRTVENSLADLCDKLNSKLKHLIPDATYIWLTLYGPVKDAKSYKKELYNYLKGFIKEQHKVGDSREVIIANEKVDISVVQHGGVSIKKIGGRICNKNQNPYLLNIDLNAEVILAGRIRDKQKKCEKIKGPIWLALYNDYWLADNKSYVKTINNIGIKHRFDKIFVIQKTGQVHQIHPNMTS